MTLIYREEYYERSTFGERIKLCRPICNSETAEAIYTVINKCKEAFIPWLGWGTNYRKEDALSFLETADIDWNNNSQFVYAIYLENTFIGLVSVLNVAWQHKRAEIGYWLDTNYTGNGYMTEAVNMIEKSYLTTVSTVLLFIRTF